MTTIMNLHELKKSVQAEANQCVKCGLCLPHCPTYALTKNECESPRGRIALLDGIASGQLALTDKARLYLDHCLTCRACEPVCPAHVQYGKLIDRGRSMLQQLSAVKLPRSLEIALKHPWLFDVARKILHVYRITGLQFLMRKSQLLKLFKLARLDALLPSLKKSINWKNYYPAKTAEQGRVALFTGCMSNFVDQQTLLATIKVLTYCGYGVYVPAAQRCCGAIHVHAGFAEKAVQFAAVNRNVFAQLGIDKIIAVASGCAAVLQEYPLPVVDVSQFVNEIIWPENLQIKPLSQRVSLHTPCTLRNVLNQADAPIKLLQKVPQLELVSLKSTYCCGAAGLYMLEYSQISDELLQSVLLEFTAQKYDWLLTSNVGCHLQMAKAIYEKGYKTRVAHPIVLFAQQLKIL